MRLIAWPLAAVLSCLSSLVLAAPPANGWTGVIGEHADGPAPDRMVCDTADQIRQIYEAGRNNIFLARPKMDELAKQIDARGDPACLVGQMKPATIVQSIKLGPFDNPLGPAKLAAWAVELLPPGLDYSVWILVLDADDLPATTGHIKDMPEPMWGPGIRPYRILAI